MRIAIAAILSLFLTQAVSAQCGSHHRQAKAHKASYTHHGGQDIVDLAIGDENFSTLVAAVTAADLVDVLRGDGPFTVFAPTNLAFDRLPQGTVASLLQPQNKADLQAVLTYHVIPSALKASELVAAIGAGGGSFDLKTVQGGTLTASISGKHVILTDEKGGISKITTTDLKATNGYIHVIDAVVLPK